MRISIIVAMSRNRVIGKDDQMPWHLPYDLKRFKRTTMGKPLIMGRKTHEAIGRALPGRRNIVVTRQKDFKSEGCEIAQSINEAFEKCKTEDEVMVIGGAEIYKAMLPVAHRIYLTQVEAEVEGDTYFPDYDESQWKIAESEKKSISEENEFPLSYLVLDKQR